MTRENKPIVVIDTNLFINALIRQGSGKSSQLVNGWQEHRYHVATTDELIEEIRGVLKREKMEKKYGITPKEAEAFVLELRLSTRSVTPVKLADLPIHSRDKKDDPVLACAFGSGCDYLITSDEDLLILAGRPELGKLKILTVSQFLQLG
jgi:putative PIN family toxin of toxin-antitoxin system